jgi:hypothetical protein
MRRKIFTIGLTLAIIASALLVLCWYYGIFTKYNYFTAKNDIKKGNVRFIVFGLPMPSSKDREIDSVAAFYGFKNCNKGCIVSKQELNSTRVYNNVVGAYLTQRNGKNWRVKYQKTVDSLFEIAFNRN